MHIPGCQKKWDLSYTDQEKLGQSYTFLLKKKGANHISSVLKTGAIRHAHPYYVIYRKLPPRGPMILCVAAGLFLLSLFRDIICMHRRVGFRFLFYSSFEIFRIGV